MTLRKKLLGLIAVAVAGLLALAGSWVGSESSRIYAEHRAKLRDLVEGPISIVTRYERLETAGKLSRADAQRMALDELREMRFDKNNYFWVNDLQPVMLMHPLKPELNGKNLSDFVDPAGKHMFEEMAQQAKTNGSGFVEYQWSKPGQPSEKLFPKLSYTQKTQLWNWCVGAGIYIDDIQRSWRECLYKATGISILCLSLLLFVSYVVFRSVLLRLRQFNERVADLAAGDGDLTKRISSEQRDEFSALGDSINAFLDKLQSMLASIASAASDLSRLSQELEGGSAQTAQGAVKQREQTDQVATAMAEMTSTVDQVSQNTHAANELSQQSAQVAARGDNTVQSSISHMSDIANSVSQTAGKVDELGKRSEQIGAIVGVINDIADQTNLLALNAAIEAARAGDAGKGFAVVADEVRKLAERTTSSTQEISTMISSMQKETNAAVRAMQDNRKLVDKGLAATRDAGSALRDIMESSTRVSDLVAQIATATAEQSTAAASINSNIEEISGISAESAQTAERDAASLHQLAELAQTLHTLVGQFHIAEENRSSARRAREHPNAPPPLPPTTHAIQ